MKLTIEYIKRTQKTSRTKTDPNTNQPHVYTSVGLLTQEHGKDQWINGFGNKDNESWKKGDIIDVDIEEGTYNGKKTLNFSMITNNTNQVQNTVVQNNQGAVQGETVLSKIQKIEQLCIEVKNLLNNT